jgi:hypothetical protein
MNEKTNPAKVVNIDANSEEQVRALANSNYPANEDIYNKSVEEKDINPEDTSQIKTNNEKPGKNNEKDFDEDVSGSDLDVPGSELDDEQENIGSEDEENNYYSLGDNDN